jgi:hypothetical protein
MKKKTHFPSNSRVMRERPRVPACALATISAAMLISGCSHSDVKLAAQVGAASITQASVAHWASVIAQGGEVPIMSDEVKMSPREHALRFLILSQWLTGEARQLGLAPGDRQIASTIDRRERSMPGGSKEFKEALQITGETEADVRLRTAATLAAAAMRASILRVPRRVSLSEAEAYFARHRERFAVPERRKVDLAERISSHARAVALKRAMERSGDRRQLDFHESLTDHGVATANVPVARAIFGAPRGVLMGPGHLASGYALFEVEQILPSRPRRFSGFREAIVLLLERQRRRLAAARFDHEWESSWRKRTDCRPGYVIPQCKQYHGPVTRLEDPFLPAAVAHP